MRTLWQHFRPSTYQQVSFSSESDIYISNMINHSHLNILDNANGEFSSGQEHDPAQKTAKPDGLVSQNDINFGTA